MALTTTSDIQLKGYAEKMGLPLNNILMRDEMNELDKDGFYIINLDNSNGNVLIEHRYITIFRSGTKDKTI